LKACELYKIDKTAYYKNKREQRFNSAAWIYEGLRSDVKSALIRNDFKEFMRLTENRGARISDDE
jgi:hypothetical protein